MVTLAILCSDPLFKLFKWNYLEIKISARYKKIFCDPSKIFRNASRVINVYLKYFVFYLAFLSRTFMIHREQGKEEAFFLTPLHHLNRHLNISRSITAGNLLRHIASSRTRTGNLWFWSVSR